jgi:hypothetical protein
MALLHDMRQFMRQQPLADRGVRGIRVGPKNDLCTGRIGEAVDLPGGLGRLGVRVNANGAEIVFEARLEIGTCRRIQRATRGVQHLMNERGRLTHRSLGRIGALRLEEHGSRFRSAWPVGRKQPDLAEIP